MFKNMYEFFSKLINDILKDSNSTKYSATKTIALSSFILLTAIIITGLYIMIKNQEVDHFLIGELIFFILTLLGFKNLTRLGYDPSKNKKVE